MSELRHDPIQKRWVIIAGERSGRPQDFVQDNTASSHRTKQGFCPFCPGNEDKTPPETAVVKDKDNPSLWKVRAVANKYPALSMKGELRRKGIGLYDAMNGIGAHEVVVETPDHNAHISDMNTDHLVQALGVCRDRMISLMQDKRLKYVLLFKNYGADAGASLSHPHHQLIATPVTPRTVAIELQSCRDHHQDKERCLICDILTQENNSGERIIWRNNGFTALAPFASRFPFEIMIVPNRHHCAFTSIDKDTLYDLADMLKILLGGLKKLLNDPPYNYLFHTSPNTDTLPRRSHYWDTIEYDYHWHVEILPRLTKTAGFEWGTGFYINPMPPEDAAKALRDVIALGGK